MTTLSRKTIGHDQKPEPKILQFGAGNFVRAFVDWMMDILNEETDFNARVIIIKPTEGGDYSELRKQEGLFTTLLTGIGSDGFAEQIHVVKCIQEVIHPYNDFKRYLATAHLPTMRFVVSNTTEAGITFNDSDRFEDAPALEFPGKLTQWLFERFEHFKGAADRGCIFLPCELIEDNGARLKETILQYAAHWDLGEKFTEWIEQHNIFCDTLVDRIVSGHPKSRIEELQKSLGYTDDLLVEGEGYHSWIIKGTNQVEQEIPFSKTDLNVKFVNDLAPYRDLKVRLLNGAHTAMVPVGLLVGLQTVNEAMDSPVAKFVEGLLFKEIVPNIKNVPEEEVREFAASVLDRFKNPALQHYLKAISLNSTTKFQTRLLASLQDFQIVEHKLPKRIVFSLAALLQLYSGLYKGHSFELKDNASTLEFFKQQWSDYHGGKHDLFILVKKLLGNTAIFGESLKNLPGIEEAVAGCLQKIQNGNVLEIIQQEFIKG